MEADVQEGCELSLRDLQLDHLDLYLIHWPARVRKGAVTGKMTKDDQLGYSEDLMAKTWRVRGRGRKEGAGKEGRRGERRVRVSGRGGRMAKAKDREREEGNRMAVGGRKTR